MIPIISIVGRSGSGKTTVIEKIVQILKQRGYRVGTIKHHRHPVDVDTPGKDTWRHAQAGADTVLLATPQKLSMVKQLSAEASPAELRDIYLDDVDVILAEGYKRGQELKIEVFRSTVHEQPLYTPTEHFAALISDQQFSFGIPCFGLEEIVPLVDWLEETVLLTPGEKR